MLQGSRLIAAIGSALVVGSTGALSQTPKKGGILHYALTTEPPNYDCHGNTNYGVSQGVFSHYSRLLKDAGDWRESEDRRRRRGKLGDRPRRSNLHLQAAQGREIPRRVVAYVGRRSRDL